MSDNPEALTLGRIAREEFDAYCHEDSDYSESEAWEKAAQAVVAALAQQAATPTGDLTVPPPLPEPAGNMRHPGVPGIYDGYTEGQIHARDAIWAERVAAAAQQAATPAPAEHPGFRLPPALISNLAELRHMGPLAAVCEAGWGRDALQAVEQVLTLHAAAAPATPAAQPAANAGDALPLPARLEAARQMGWRQGWDAALKGNA